MTGSGRRNLLLGGLTALGLGHARRASATEASAPDTAKVILELPELVEDGRFVPLTVRVQSPMPEADHVRRITIRARDNPNPEIAVFHLSARNGRAEIATRIRLARTQQVTATAEMSDGSLHVGAATVKVALGGCG